MKECLNKGEHACGLHLELVADPTKLFVGTS